MHVALLVTCLTDAFYPRAGVAVVRVLEKLGCTVAFPRAQTCCGQPMYNNGLHDDARALAARTIELFRPYACVVTPSGSCAAMVKVEYPHLFEHEASMKQAALAMAAKTHEFSSFLLNVLKADLSEAAWQGAITVHEPCHGRAIGNVGTAARLLQRINGVERRPLDLADQCCGFGGAFTMKFPEVSGELVRDKTDAIRASGARTVVSGDAGCTLNLSGACRRAACDVTFKHPAEIVAEAMGLMNVAH